MVPGHLPALHLLPSRTILLNRLLNIHQVPPRAAQRKPARDHGEVKEIHRAWAAHPRRQFVPAGPNQSRHPLPAVALRSRIMSQPRCDAYGARTFATLATSASQIRKTCASVRLLYSGSEISRSYSARAVG